MQEIIIHTTAASQYLAHCAEAQREVDILDGEAVLRHFISCYDQAERNGAGGTHDDGTPFYVIESMWLRGAAHMARQFISDRDQLARVKAMAERE